MRDDGAYRGSGGLMSRRTFVTLVGAASLAGLASACSGTPGNASDAGGPGKSDGLGERSQTVFCFDTVCTFTAIAPAETLDAAVELCERYENLFSRTIEGSDVSRINAAGGAPTEVDGETARLIEEALAYCAASEGLFDITIGSVSSLWDFKEGIVPDGESIARALEHVDYTQVRVDGTTVQLLDPQAMIDLGGIAKGYIADRLVEHFIADGVESCTVNLGGNVKTIGSRPDGTPWRVGIQNPEPGKAEEQSVVAVVESEGTSVVTSGLYERVFEQGGKRYWHILDPRTGYPVETSIMSATIVSEASIDGDGYTKPLFMWDRGRIEAFFDEHPELEGMLIDLDGNVWQSPNSSFELL